MQVLQKEILDDIFTVLSKKETVYRNYENKGILVKEFIEIWKINTEVQVNEFLKEVSFYIGFDEFFPLSIPKIYLCQDDYNIIKYIPHVDNKCFVCTFNTDLLILDQKNPLGIVETCLRKAKKIIQEGIEGMNHSDFIDEIGAYWTEKEENEKEISEGHYLSLIINFPKQTSTIKIAKLSPDFNLIRYILFNDESEFKYFEKFLRKSHINIIITEALFLSDYKPKHVPPFALKNGDIISLISSESLLKFKKYINAETNEKHIFFLTETTSVPILLGWRHKYLNNNPKGFRKGYLNKFDVLTKIQKNDLVERILVKEYSNNRVELRTSGMIQKKYQFLLAGLGSIGSNLLYFLNGINYPSYKLIDDDILKIENIGRHLLGLNDINKFKVDGLEEYVKNIRPDQDVSVMKKKLEFIVLNNIDYFNDCSYAFVAIGNQNIENLLLKLHAENKITIPMFLFWVEPYVLGGHCVFIHPNDKIKIEELYEKNFYRFNIIKKKEYENNNPILTKKEAGCQTAYIPYSNNDIILFLSSIYLWINDIIRNESNRSMIASWVGDISLAKKLGIDLTSSDDSFSFKLFNINDGN